MSSSVSWEDFNMGFLLREVLKGRVMVLIPEAGGVAVRLLDRGHLTALQLLQSEHTETEPEKPSSTKKEEQS